jgi:ubiquinol-cytochrome c reductase cytochrome b subunit
VIDGYTLVPNPFWGGALYPLLVFGFLYVWPFVERRFAGDYAYHNLLDRPRDAPWRTAIGVGIFTNVFLVFLAGASDRVFVLLNIRYVTQLWLYRVLFFVGPFVAAGIAYRVCVELVSGERVERERKRAEHEAKAAAGEA